MLKTNNTFVQTIYLLLFLCWCAFSYVSSHWNVALWIVISVYQSKEINNHMCLSLLLSGTIVNPAEIKLNADPSQLPPHWTTVNWGSTGALKLGSTSYPDMLSPVRHPSRHKFLVQWWSSNWRINEGHSGCLTSPFIQTMKKLAQLKGENPTMLDW